jgi:hypothetical protein
MWMICGVENRQALSPQVCLLTRQRLYEKAHHNTDGTAVSSRGIFGVR